MAIATLIASGRLTRDDIWRAADLLDDARLKPREWNWIDEGDAADVEFDGPISQARAILEGRFEGTDIIVQPAEAREKKLLVADMDSTVIGQECIDELADYAGIKPEIAAITERAMQGELDFAHALAERVSLLKGMEEAEIGRCLAERIRTNPGADILISTMRSRGAETVLVSGGFTAFVAPIAKAIGFDRFEANVLGVSGGLLTGIVEGRIVDSSFKRQVLVKGRERLGLDASQTLAVGDGANDIPMIDEAGLGIAYRAKPALAAVADARLDHHGLHALLWAQGIPRREWAAT